MLKGNKVTSNFSLCLAENASCQGPVSFMFRLHYPWEEASGTHRVPRELDPRLDRKLGGQKFVYLPLRLEHRSLGRETL
jgi:hypothetical protein